LDYTSVKLEMMTSAAILKRVSSRYKDALKKNFKYVVEDSTAKIARLEISSFSLSGKFFDVSQQKFKRLLKQRFAQIKEDSIQHLLIDFRGNGGGYIPNVRRFVSYLAKEPFQLVDSLAFKKSAISAIAPWYSIFPPLITRLVFRKSQVEGYLGRKNPAKPFHDFPKTAFSGKTYFLMDGGSYSATTFTLGLLYDQGVGTYIGTQPGGANWGSFAVNWKDAKLPHSKLILHIPLFKIDHRLPNQRAKSFFIQPDLWVEPSWQDFLDRKDTVVEFTKQMIRSSVTSK
ncbi:MAG: S41 family peptidase, partial [Spirosomataceae bacterium]